MNILIIMDNSVENILYLDPFIASLDDKYKDPEIYILCDSNNANYIENWDRVNNIIKYHPKAGMFEKYTLYSRFKNISFSITFDFTNRNLFFLKFFLKTELIYKLDKKEYDHPYKKYESMLLNIESEMYKNKPVWNFPKDFSYKVGKVKAPLLTVLPFDNNADNKKNISFYLYVISEFFKRYNSSIILLGDEKYLKIGKSFDVYDYVFNNIGNTDLNQDAFVLKYSTVILGSDTKRLLLAKSVSSNVLCIESPDREEENTVLSKIYSISDSLCN